MRQVPAPMIVVVTPVFEDSEASSRLFAELARVLGPGLRIVAVDDGSVRTVVDPASIAAAGLDGVVIRLKRNVGHQRAIAIGLSYVAEHLAHASCIVVMDSDGEDRPESIPEMIAALGPSGVVVAKRRNRVESLLFRGFYAVYRWLFQIATGRGISFGNFMALSPESLRRLVAMQELWTHVAACVLASKLPVRLLPLDRGPRYAGSSHMNFVGLALHGFRALMVFAEDVLVRVGIACALVAALSVLGMAAAVLLKVIGFATPGWFSVALAIMQLIFMQTGTLVLVSLMLTGVVRSGSIALLDWRDFVAAIREVDPARVPARASS
jgi:glycosyltransferase involved in cell wall biosynthesis